MAEENKKRKKFKIRINFQKVTRYFYIITFISTIIILAYTSFFLYKNFYQTIVQSDIILVLQEKVASETVNINKFNKIIELLDNKTKEKDRINIKNPFD